MHLVFFSDGGTILGTAVIKGNGAFTIFADFNAQ